MTWVSFSLSQAFIFTAKDAKDCKTKNLLFVHSFASFASFAVKKQQEFG